MGYKICTPGVQNFLGYKMAKWGTVPQNGVRLATLHPVQDEALIFFFVRKLVTGASLPGSPFFEIHPCKRKKRI